MTITFDTNVLVYASLRSGDPKVRAAQKLIEQGMRSGRAVLLLQTLAEFSHVALRKMSMPAGSVRRLTDAWRIVLPVHAAEEEDLFEALRAVEDHQISFWDAMLWATARRVGVRHLLTEDLQDGRVLDSVRFVNPFISANRPAIEQLLTSV